MNVNDRVREVRKALNMNQTDFGARIAVGQGYLANIESGSREVTEKIFKLICLEFSVNEKWLRTGEGEMFEESDDSIVTALLSEYGLSPLEQSMVKTFLTLTPENRKGVLVYVKKLIASVMENYNEYAAEIPLSQSSLDDGTMYDELSAQLEKANNAGEMDEKRKA